MFALNAINAPDTYNGAASGISAAPITSTIENVGPIDHVVLDVSNAAIIWNLKLPVGANGQWDGTEVYMLPGSRRLPGSEGCMGVRIRAAIAGQTGTGLAVVTIMAVQ